MEKKLYKIEEGKKLSGVCGGLAEYLNMDVTLVRLLWALVTAFTAGFLGIIAYVVCALILPNKSEVVQ